jgi:hypothetical protein
LGAGIILMIFMLFPSPVAVLIGIIAAFILYKSSTNEKIDTLVVVVIVKS